MSSDPIEFMPTIPREQFLAMRLYEMNEDIDLRIERLNRRIEVLNQQIAINDAQLVALNDQQEYPGDDLFEEYEYEDYPDTDSDCDSDTETVVEPWEDPSQTPSRGYSLYYPRYLDEGLECLEDI